MPGGIEIKTRDEIAYMREASLIVYQVLEECSRAAAPGVTLEELDSIAERETVRRGGICAFKGLYGFPKNICISVNEQVVHGIPTRRKLVEGDLLKDRKSTRLNSSHLVISYAVFCLKKKKKNMTI